MTTATASFRDWLAQEIRGVLNRPGKEPHWILWCDPDRTWLDLLRDCAAHAGFELWADEDVHELLVRERFFAAPSAARVVWLPVARDGIRWFKVFELEAHLVWERSLLEALREYGVEIARDHEAELIGNLPAHAREWFDKPKATWKELTPGNVKETLFHDERMLEILAGPPGEFARVQAEGRFEIFAARAVKDFGLPDPASLTEEAWRVAATARLLCTDAAENHPQEPPREGDKIIPAGLARTHSLRVLKQWQRDLLFFPIFEKLVPQAETTVGLSHWARNLPTMPRSFSSRAVEETLFAKTADRLDRLEEIDGLLAELERESGNYQTRASRFWGAEASSPVGWRYLVDLARVAAQLVENRGIEDSWKKLSDAIDWYTDRGWKLDQTGEQLFKEEAELPKELHRVRVRLRRGYLRTMDRVGRAFSELLARSPGKLAALPTAGELALAELQTPSTPTALVFLDACRFDLGQRLAELLNQGEPVTRASVRAAVAPLPSVTALGMPFALPMQRDQLQVQLGDDGKFAVTCSGFAGDLKWAEQRRKWLKETWDVKDWFEMEEVLDGESLKKPGRSRKLIAVHGAELDAHDGQLQLTGADDHLRRYVQAIRKLREAGYHRVIVVTDHGFFHWQPDDHELEEQPPSGDVQWKHRRAMVGHGLSHPTAVKLAVPQADLEVLAPRSTSAFRTYGALGFFHGGATLQELIIPVIVASWPLKAKKVSVVLKPVGYFASELPRVQVQASATGQLFNVDTNLLSRRVVVKVKNPATGTLVFQPSQQALIEPEGGAVTLQLSLVEPKPSLPRGTKLVVEVLDADDEELLVREEIELKIDIDEDF